MKLMIAVSFVATCSVLTSCGTLQTKYYTINTDPDIGRSVRQLPLTLLVANINSPTLYQDQIAYRPSRYEIGFYEYSRWIEPPPEMVRTAIVNALTKAGLFKSVDSAGVTSSPDLTLRGEIMRFDQEIADDGYFANFELGLELVKGLDGERIWKHQAPERVRQRKKGKFAAAMSEAVGKAISSSIMDMESSTALIKLAEEKRKPPNTAEQ